MSWHLAPEYDNVGSAPTCSCCEYDLLLTSLGQILEGSALALAAVMWRPSVCGDARSWYGDAPVLKFVICSDHRTRGCAGLAGALHMCAVTC